MSQSWGDFGSGGEHFGGIWGLTDISRRGCEGAGWWDPSIKSGLRAQAQGLTHQASLLVSAVWEEVARALGEWGQGDKLEHPRHRQLAPRSSLGRQRRVRARCILAGTLPLLFVRLPVGLERVCIALGFFPISSEFRRQPQRGPVEQGVSPVS